TTCVSPPLAVAGMVNLAVLPCSLIDRGRLDSLAAPPPPHPATATPAAVTATAMRAPRGEMCVDGKDSPPRATVSWLDAGLPGAAPYPTRRAAFVGVGLRSERSGGS